MDNTIMQKLVEELVKNLNITKNDEGDIVISSNASVCPLCRDRDNDWVTVEFDDSMTKESIHAYKDVVDVLDESSFKEYLAYLASALDIDTFNKLTDKESFNEDEANVVDEMVFIATTKLKKYLKDKVERYNDAIGLCNAILD